MLRALTIFSISFGGAYGFIAGSRADISNYDPQSFAIGTSFLFAAACVGLAMLSMRLRWMVRQIRRMAERYDRLSDRNWEIQEAAERTRQLFEMQGDLVIRRDAAGLITYANEAYCRLADSTRENLIGSMPALTIIEESNETVSPGGICTCEQKIAAPGGLRWIAWRESQIRVETGQPAERLCIGRDVSERAQTERALTAARDEATAANRAKSRFLAMASHEIRNPLNGIIGLSGLLLETPLTPEQSTYATAVKSSGEALLALIEDLLDFSKIEADRIDVNAHPFRLATFAEEIAELVAPRAQTHGLEIATFVDERLPAEVIGDAARLRQVLLNLLGNAIKFTTTGGVALIAEPGESEGQIVFMVRDTGIGIAPQARARIFREFEQADDTVARDYGGTGLGLAISERIIKRMGGRITLESTPGVGSTFAVAVPLPPAPASAAPAFDTPDLSGRSILIVSPLAIEPALIAGRLQRWGAQTCCISDAEVASALLPERVWHAILLDLAIGADTARRLAEMAAPHAAQRIVVMTPAERRATGAIEEAGFTGFLIKPLRAASLAARLRPAEDLAPPLQPAEIEGAPADIVPDKPESPHGLSILVAEDNAVNALLMRALLTRLGHRPTIADDGEAAFDSWLAAQAGGVPYDLILMDVQMPKLDGLALACRIRDHEARDSRSRTRIIALTANAQDSDRTACLDAGMDDVLIKPLDRAKLEALLRPVSATAA